MEENCPTPLEGSTDKTFMISTSKEPEYLHVVKAAMKVSSPLLSKVL